MTSGGDSARSAGSRRGQASTDERAQYETTIPSRGTQRSKHACLCGRGRRRLTCACSKGAGLAGHLVLSAVLGRGAARMRHGGEQTFSRSKGHATVGFTRWVAAGCAGLASFFCELIARRPAHDGARAVAVQRVEERAHEREAHGCVVLAEGGGQALHYVRHRQRRKLGAAAGRGAAPGRVPQMGMGGCCAWHVFMRSGVLSRSGPRTRHNYPGPGASSAAPGAAHGWRTVSFQVCVHAWRGSGLTHRLIVVRLVAHTAQQHPPRPARARRGAAAREGLDTGGEQMTAAAAAAACDAGCVAGLPPVAILAPRVAAPLGGTVAGIVARGVAPCRRGLRAGRGGWARGGSAELGAQRAAAPCQASIRDTV